MQTHVSNHKLEINLNHNSYVLAYNRMIVSHVRRVTTATLHPITTRRGERRRAPIFGERQQKLLTTQLTGEGVEVKPLTAIDTSRKQS